MIVTWFLFFLRLGFRDAGRVRSKRRERLVGDRLKVSCFYPSLYVDNEVRIGVAVGSNYVMKKKMGSN